MALINCKECGKQISDLAAACPNCGFPIAPLRAQPSNAATSGKSRSIAVALALLLGGLGLHKFYLNRPGLGVLYILFCWTLIPAAIAFIEGLRYLFMSDVEFEQQYSSVALVSERKLAPIGTIDLPKQT